MPEKKLQLTDQTGTPTDLKLSTPNGEKIIVQPSQRYEDRLVGAVLENTTGTALGIVLTIGGALLAIKWLGLPDALKTFLDIQRSTSDSISKLAEAVEDLIRDHEKSIEDIKELKSDVRDIKDDVIELKHTTNLIKCPHIK
jgi:hypothetical protein